MSGDYVLKSMLGAFLKGADGDIPSIRKFALKSLGEITLAMVREQLSPEPTDPPYILTNLVATLTEARQHCPEPLRRRIDMALHGARRNGYADASPPEPEGASYEGSTKGYSACGSLLVDIPQEIYIAEQTRVRVTTLPEKGA